MKRAVLILRIVIGLAFFVLAAELCARLDDSISYGAPFRGAYTSEVLYEHDQIGQRGRPGARYKKWQLNGLGYRGPDLRNETIRIVCFGASETFGLYEAEGEEFPRQFERDLNRDTHENLFQVVNVAYPGETVATSILRVPEIADTIHPRFAVIYPSPALYIWLPWIGPAKTVAPVAKANKFEFRIADRVRIALKSILPERLQTRLRQRDIDAAAADYHVMSHIPEENVARYSHDLSALLDALRLRGIEPVLVTHPDPFGENPTDPDYQLLTSWRKFYPMLTEDGFIDMERRMNDAVRNLASAKHVQLVDAAREIPPRHEYFGDFCHFTTLGAGLMAQHLADSLAVQKDVAASQSSLLLQDRSRSSLKVQDSQ